MRATKQGDRPHARIYSYWLDLPTWKALSPTSKSLLVEMLGRYRPGENGLLTWSVRRVGEVIGCSKDTAAQCLIALERNGWISVCRVAAFGGRARPAAYRLNMFPCSASGEPPSRAFEQLPGECNQVRRQRTVLSGRRDKAVPLVGRVGPARGTGQSAPEDTITRFQTPMTVSEILRNSSIFNELTPESPHRRNRR
jgi:hypothetical protein